MSPGNRKASLFLLVRNIWMNDDFDPAILGATLLRLVASNRPAFAIAHGLDSLGGDIHI